MSNPTDQTAKPIGECAAKILHQRPTKDCYPVTSAQVYAVIMHNPSMFTKEDGAIRLLI